MSLVVSWLLFPLVLGLLSLGSGLLLEFVAGQEIPRTLLLPLGFAAIVVVSLCTTASSETAHLTTPLVVALAAAGLVLAFPWRPRRGGGWAAAAAVATYAALGAPVFLSGSATFTLSMRAVSSTSARPSSSAKNGFPPDTSCTLPSAGRGRLRPAARLLRR